MNRSLKAHHLPRYLEIGRLLLEHRDAVTLSKPGSSNLGDDSNLATEKDAGQLVDELEAMGPTFVKFGQLLSTRSDLLPPVYLTALARLQDNVAPLDDGVAIGVVEVELGIRVSKAFASFQRHPIASASLGQVHRATLRDGREVAVKVQRPGIKEQVFEDMAIIEELGDFIEQHSEAANRIGFLAMLEQFRKSLIAELDYRLEAANLRRLGEQLQSHRLLVVPQPIGDYTTEKVLTMDFVDGHNISSIGPLGQMELDGAPLIDDLFRAYLDQVLVHGFFHADPHPGNVLLTADNRLALIDLGMVAMISPSMQEILLRMLLALSEQRGDDVAEALIRLGEPLEDFEPVTFRRRVSELVMLTQNATAATIQVGSLLGELARLSSECGLRPPPELAMLAKTLLNLDEIARSLDPTFDPNVVVRDHATELMRQHMLEEVSPRRLLAATLDTKEFMEKLPSRLNRVLDTVAEGEYTFKVHGFDEPELMRAIQKLANRVGIGIVVAALLIAAAIFSDSRSASLFGGYPIVTFIYLFLAFVGAVWLVMGIVRGDLPPLRRPSRRL